MRQGTRYRTKGGWTAEVLTGWNDSCDKGVRWYVCAHVLSMQQVREVSSISLGVPVTGHMRGQSGEEVIIAMHEGKEFHGVMDCSESPTPMRYWTDRSHKDAELSVFDLVRRIPRARGAHA